MKTKTQAIKAFLTNNTLPELSAMYTHDMEVQVNVHKGPDGERCDRAFEGRKWIEWSNGFDTWKSFRIPYNADSDPEYEDHPLNFSLDKYADAIGMTGWNWRLRKSMWVAYDFDSIATHKAGIDPKEMEAVKEAASAIPWVTTRYSTSGTGLHLYVDLDPISTANHTEHAAVGRTVLAKMSALTGFDFDNKVDICGGNMWIWARKMRGTKGLQIIKEAERTLVLTDDSWKEQLDVCMRKTRSRIIKQRDMAECVSNAPGVDLNDSHKEFMKWMEEHAEKNHWWDQDHRILVAHTADLKRAHDALDMVGIFETDTSGSSDHNCFMYPLDDGSWSVRRFGQGCSEAACWQQDGNGWTQIDYNRLPTFDVACATYKGTETEKDGYVFFTLAGVHSMLKALGSDYKVPDVLEGRPISIKQKGAEKKIILSVEYTEDLSRVGWSKKTAKKWQKIVQVRLSKATVGVDNYDHVIRKLITESGTSAGWVVKADGKWVAEKDANVARVLTTFGLKTTEAQQVMGTSVLKPHVLVNRPFEPEYLGGRLWNRSAPQLNFEPSREQKLEHPTWDSIFDHIGKSLTPFVRREPWCIENSIVTGGDYIRCWVASLLQYPHLPLPYLFIYGQMQNTGKSTFWESLKLLFDPGVVRAEYALKNQTGFNAELEGALLCIVEEEKLPAKAIDKIKSWVTGQHLSIRRMYQEPYEVPNYTHWIQTANPVDACPVFDGDTRITMINVRQTPNNDIPRQTLQQLLKKEAPAVLGRLLRLELPEHQGRLRIPIITTDDKHAAQDVKGGEMDMFLRLQYRHEGGSKVLWKEFCSDFNKQLMDTDWSERKIRDSLNLEKHPVAQDHDDGKIYICNLTLKTEEYNTNDYYYIAVNGFIEKEKYA